MKSLVLIVVAAALGGCATYPDGRGYGYVDSGTRPADPSQWRVVSVTPVPAGTGERIAATSPNGAPTEFSSRPISPQEYQSSPVYAPAPVYYPEPTYFYPPVTLSLGFVFGNRWGHGHRHRGGHLRGHRR